MGKNKKQFPPRGNPTIPPADDTRVIDDPEAGLPEILDDGFDAIGGEFRPFPEASASPASPADRFDLGATSEPDAFGFPDEEVTPPIADLPTTSQAVDDLLTQVQLGKQKIDELQTEIEQLNIDHLSQVSARSEAEADLTMIRERVAELERHLAETEASRSSAFEDAHLAAQKIVALENRLLASELNNTDIQWKLTKHEETIASLAGKKIWCLVPKQRPDQKKPIRLFVLATGLIEAVERGVRAEVLMNHEDVAHATVHIERVIF